MQTAVAIVTHVEWIASETHFLMCFRHSTLLEIFPLLTVWFDRQPLPVVNSGNNKNWSMHSHLKLIILRADGCDRGGVTFGVRSGIMSEEEDMDPSGRPVTSGATTIAVETCHENFGPRPILVRPDQNAQPEMVRPDRIIDIIRKGLETDHVMQYIG